MSRNGKTIDEDPATALGSLQDETFCLGGSTFNRRGFPARLHNRQAAASSTGGDDEGECVAGCFMDPVDKQYCQGGTVKSGTVDLDMPQSTDFSSSNAPEIMSTYWDQLKTYWSLGDGAQYSTMEGGDLRRRQVTSSGGDAAMPTLPSVLFSTTLSGQVPVFFCECPSTSLETIPTSTGNQRLMARHAQVTPPPEV
ncbi:MAG: hypothetical protein Q9227_008107 [Pyrenula ochraceoflavens]